MNKITEHELFIKTGRHDIAEILLKVALKHQKSNQLFILIHQPIWQMHNSMLAS
jgi:hypothetical protein